MRRRNFIASLGATLLIPTACKMARVGIEPASAATEGKELLLPRALKPGDTV